MNKVRITLLVTQFTFEHIKPTSAGTIDITVKNGPHLTLPVEKVEFLKEK